MKHSDFDALYSCYSKQLYAFILWMTRNSATADDILQTVFVKVWNHNGGPSNEAERRRWLFTVTRNTCMDSFRSLSRFSQFRSRYSTEVFHEEEDASPTVELGETGKFLAHLPTLHRTILYLHLVAGYSYAEIGEMLSLTEVNVRVKAFRSLKRLREIMITRNQ